MAGGLMQLVAYGAQDVYLTGQPKVTFFQAVYKRHTNFAMENIIQTLNGSASSGGRVSVTIARNGDLVGNMYVALYPLSTLNATSVNTGVDINWVAERAIADVELTIGGQRIDKHFQAWWRLYSELFLTDMDKVQWGKMTTFSNAPTANGTDRVFLPLLFFFNRNPGLYLPLIALQYHEVRLDFNLTGYFNSFFQQNRFDVWANYVFLDTEERRRFAQKGHEYLIEQLQHTGSDSISGIQTAVGTNSAEALIRLSYNHPVKELIWCYTDPNYPGTGSAAMNSMWNFTSNVANVNVTSNLFLFNTSNNYVLPHHIGTPHLFSGNGTLAGNAFWTEDGLQANANGRNVEVGPLNTFRLVLNGQDRFATQPGKYFNQVQPFYHHTGNPYPGIYCYSFALQPEEHQPTGTCNFSRIDNAQVAVSVKGGINTGTVQRMFAVNYNILRIQSGMGGLAFSN
jgi:hypothetical protein